jgi:hypothetical protein
LLAECSVLQNNIYNIKIKVYRIIILSVDLYGCENLSLKLKEEIRLRVFENTVLRRVFGVKRDQVKGVREPA